MIDTKGGHYGIILETQWKKNIIHLEDTLSDELGVLFLEDKQKELCSFKVVRRVHKVNCNKQKDQMIAAYRNIGWMSLELRNIIPQVLNNCKVCQKFNKLVMRPRVTLPKSQAFNKVVTLDLKEFGYK